MSYWNAIRDTAAEVGAAYLSQYGAAGSTLANLYRDDRQRAAQKRAIQDQINAQKQAQAAADAENARYAAEQAAFAAQVDTKGNTPSWSKAHPTLTPQTATGAALRPVYLVGGMVVVLLVAIAARR